MNIIDILYENIALLANPFTPLYEDMPGFNLKADAISGDIAWIAFPIESPIRQTKGGAFEPTRPINIFFCKKTDLGDPTKDSTKPIDHSTVCYNMELICEKFLTLLQKDSRIREVSEASTKHRKNQTDSNLTGCVLSVKLKQLPNSSVC